MASKKQKFNTSQKIFSKLTLIALVFLFVFQPIWCVFAQKKIDYAYDHNGQRIMEKVTTTSYDSGTGYTTTTIETTYYSTPTYNLTKTTTEVRDKTGNLISTETGEETTKHVFANNLDIATIEGNGKDAVIYFNFADQLQSSSVTTDASGAIVETTDYYAFGKIRTDNKTTDFAEQRKYIGQEFDEDTGLNYLNARYYNSAIARFVTQDPVFWNFDSSWLSDPQNQNAYAYARNNPIIYSDQNGKYAEVVMVACGPLGIGAHGYINIVPSGNINFSQYGGDGSHYTIGGYPSSNDPRTNQLQVQINESGNYNTKYSDRLLSMPLTIPYGMNVDQYDQKLLESGYAMSQKNLGDYFGLGRPTEWHANSGNAWTQVVADAGGEVPYIPSIILGPGIMGSKTPHYPFGSGNSINTAWFPIENTKNIVSAAKQTVSYAGQLISGAYTASQTKLNSISATLSRISSTINSLLKNN